MWLSRGFLSIILFAYVGSACGEQSVKCPEKHKHGGSVAVLEDVDVFDGPLEQRAILMPDLDTSEWKLRIEQDEARKRKEHLYLVCHYKGTPDLVALEIPYVATFCNVEGTKTGIAAGCRPMPDNVRKKTKVKK